MVPRNDWMMGRVAPRDGRKPFKLDIDYLLQTDGKSGDVLAKLIDLALNNGADQRGSKYDAY